MKAKLGIAFEELRGKAGNSVGKLSNQGQILMVRSVGRDPKVQSQIRSRQLLTLLARRWAALTQEQRDGWNTAAGLKRSGYDLFCEYNTNLNSVSSAFLDDYHTPRTLTYPTDVQVDVKPSAHELIFTVKGSINQGNFKLLVKISVFSPRLMSSDSYRFVNLISMIYSTNRQFNAYDLVVGRTDLNVQTGYYFKTEYYVIDTLSGARVLGGGDTLQWQDTEQPYIPEMVITINKNTTEFNSGSDSGYVGGSYSVSNYDSTKEAKVEMEYIIWNDATATSRFFRRTIYSDETLLNSDTIGVQIDGGEFPSTWAKGIKKYIELVATVSISATGQTFEYHSDFVEITAS